MGEPAWEIPAVPLPDWLGTPRVPRSARYAGPMETFDIPPGVRQDFKAVLADRQKARDTRDELALGEIMRTLDRHEARELSTARYEVNEASRELGEMAGEAFIDKHFTDAQKIYPPDGAPSRSGDFDQVWKAKDKDGHEVMVVIEAKGGSSGLGGRLLADGTFAQQGSAAYFDRIVEVMKKDGADVAEEISWARMWDNVRYYEVRAPLAKEEGGRTTLQPIEARQFDLSGRP